MFSGRGRWDDKAFCVICRPLAEGAGEAFQPSVCCLHLVWLGRFAPNKGRWDSSCPSVWRETGENQGRRLHLHEDNTEHIIPRKCSHFPSRAPYTFQVSRSQTPPYADMQDAKPRALLRFLQDRSERQGRSVHSQRWRGTEAREPPRGATPAIPKYHENPKLHKAQPGCFYDTQAQNEKSQDEGKPAH